MSAIKAQSIVQEAATEVPWIHFVSREDRGYRAAEVGMVQAYETGYEQLVGARWGYLARLDAGLRCEER